MTTVVQQLCEKVRACGSVAGGSLAPAAILWTDPHRHFAGAMPLIKQQLPELVELGAFCADEWRGPAIWVRCVVDGTLPRRSEAADWVPVVYMPGVARQQLRAGEDCPEELRPLVELLYRGHAWVHQGGHDHTLSAFLKSSAHLGLDVAEDAATNRALVNAAREVLAASVVSLSGRRLEADDFNKLVVGDADRDLLRWMGDPVGVENGLPPQRWHAFAESVRINLRLDLKLDGNLSAAERLCESEGAWASVWNRFVDAPDSYPGLLDVLAKVEAPSAHLFERGDAARYLSANNAAEEALKVELLDLKGCEWGKARTRILALEQVHGERRAFIWNRTGHTRWANLLAPLARLAEGVGRPIGGISADDLSREYERVGWTTDLALLEVLEQLDGPTDDGFRELARNLIQEWLDSGARRLQSVMQDASLSRTLKSGPINAEEGCCRVFVDGLRYDLGRLLADELEGRGCRVAVKARWSGLPSVTATGKAAVSPVAEEIEGRGLEPSFAPVFRVRGRQIDAASLRTAIEERGGQVIAAGDFPNANSGTTGGWHETGDIDKLGHKFNASLAKYARSEVRNVAESILNLLKSGWRKVRVVTDHGWLLLPGGLPKYDLPRHLVETKWARCALLQGDAPQGVVLVPWHWNPEHVAATPPGIACFRAGVEYAHGGLSIQECLTPEIVVEMGDAGVQAIARFVRLVWVKHRCEIEVRGAPVGATVDVRVESTNGRSVMKAPKPLDAKGGVSVPVEDDYDKKQLVVVLLDAVGTVIAQRKTRVGEAT